MTILNTNNNISEDYTYLIGAEEVFYPQSSISSSIFTYSTQWNVLSGNNATTIYETIQDNFASILQTSGAQLINIDTDFEDLLSEDGLYVGVTNNNQSNFPTFTFPTNANHYFSVIITNSIIGAMPIKTLSLENKKIVDISTYTPSSDEYFSAKQVSNIVNEAIAVDITNYYTKTEIDNKIDDIQDYLHS